MRARLLLVLLLAASGCRFEAPPDGPPACDCADGRDVADAPPDAAADTARVTPQDAGQGDPDDDNLAIAPSGLVVPVRGVDPGDLVDTFRAARSEGRTHNAIDILAPRGTPVVAAARGTVARLFESEKGGRTIYVLGADRRTVFYYAHLDAIAPGLAAGQRVRRGQRLGTVGDSGNAAPGNTHLHFAIWRTADPADFWDGEPVNPYPLLTE